MIDGIGALAGLQQQESNNGDVFSSGSLGKEDFLNLLVTQMQNQDPLDPLKNEQFVAQMAQFSSLEQLMNLNETMGQIQLLESSINNNQAVNLIGKRVTVQGSAMQIQDGSAGSFTYALPGEAQSVTISLYDSSGALVRSIEQGRTGAGRHDIAFDGLDREGNQLPDGDYTWEVTAKDADGEEMNTATFSDIQITGITFDSGIVYLLSGESKFRLGDIVEVRGK